MKIHIVCEACDDSYFEGSPKFAFSTKKLAEEFVEKNPNKEYYIEEFEVDKEKI